MNLFALKTLPNLLNLENRQKIKGRLFAITYDFNGMSMSKNQKVSGNCGTEIFSLNLIFDRKAGFLLYLLPLHGLEFYIFSHTKCTVHCGPDFRHHGKLLEVAWVVGDSKK